MVCCVGPGGAWCVVWVQVYAWCVVWVKVVHGVLCGSRWCMVCSVGPGVCMVCCVGQGGAWCVVETTPDCEA